MTHPLTFFPLLKILNVDISQVDARKLMSKLSPRLRVNRELRYSITKHGHLKGYLDVPGTLAPTSESFANAGPYD